MTWLRLANHRAVIRMARPRNRSAGAVVPGPAGRSIGSVQMAMPMATLTMLARRLTCGFAGVARSPSAGFAGGGLGGCWAVARPGVASWVSTACVIAEALWSAETADRGAVWLSAAE